MSNVSKMDNSNYFHMLVNYRNSVIQDVETDFLIFCECKHVLYVEDITYNIPSCRLFCKKCRNLYSFNLTNKYRTIEWMIEEDVVFE